MSIVESPHTFCSLKNEASENNFQRRKIFVTKTLSEPRAESLYFYKCLSFKVASFSATLAKILIF